MSVALATTYHDRKDRLYDQIVRTLPTLTMLFAHIALQASAVAPSRSLGVLRQIGASIQQTPPSQPTGVQKLGHVRRAAVALALQAQTPTILFFDFDSLLHWVEAYPHELAAILQHLSSHDMTIIGRTHRAFETHPESQRVTEAWVNQVFARLTGHTWDVMRSGRGLSRRAAEAIVRGCNDDTISTDVSWPLFLLQPGQFALTSIAVEGTEFETPDRYGPEINQAGGRTAWLGTVDADPRRWAHRCHLAQMHMEAMVPYAGPSTRLEDL